MVEVRVKIKFEVNVMQKLYEALAKAQSEFTQVAYDRTNPHFKSRYATLAAIEMATRPALNENGLSIVQVFKMMPDNNMILVTRLAHASGECIESEYLIVREGKSDQQIGSSITYARRFSYASMLAVSACEDDDGESTKDKPQVSKHQERKPVSKAASGTIKPEEALHIKSLVEGNVDLAKKMLMHLGVEKITEIPAAQYEYVVRELQRTEV